MQAISVLNFSYRPVWLMLLAALFAGALSIAQTVIAQAVGNGTARVTVSQKISITKIQDMDFGGLAPGTTFSTITMSGAETLMITGDAQYLGGGHGAQFLVIGEVGRTFTVSVAPDPLILTSSGDATMTAHDFVAVGQMTIGESGSIFDVYASIDIEARQAAAEYGGLFSVTANYN